MCSSVQTGEGMEEDGLDDMEAGGKPGLADVVEVPGAEGHDAANPIAADPGGKGERLTCLSMVADVQRHRHMCIYECEPPKQVHQMQLTPAYAMAPQELHWCCSFWS